MPIKPFFDRYVSKDERGMRPEVERLVNGLHMAHVRGRVIDPQIIAQFLDDSFCIARRFCFNAQAQKLASSDVCNLRVASL